MGSGVRETTHFPWSLRVSSSLAGKKIWRNLPKRTVLLLPQNSLGTSPCISELDLSPWLVSTLTISLQALCFFTSLESPPAFHAFSTCRIFPTPKPLHTVAPLPRTPFFYNQTGFLLILLLNLSVVSDSLQQHARLPCPSPSPRVCSKSCPLSRWCHPTISSSVVPFSSCPQSFPTSGSFPGSWLFASGGQIIGASASASGLTMNIQGWFPLGLTGLISQSKGFSRVFSKPQFKSISSSALSLLYGPTLTFMRVGP